MVEQVLGQLRIMLSFFFQWINAQTVVAMDTKERVHLLSVRDDLEIEVCDGEAVS